VRGVSIPDGYERRGKLGLVLVDPKDCPAGHPFRFGQRKAPELCDTHGRHLHWICACGQSIYRHDGQFVGELECVNGH
jgi:hypothetical protein